MDIGSLSTQLAESTYNEIKKETEMENQRTVSSNSSMLGNENNNSSFDMMGLKLEIPQVARNIFHEFSNAGKRVDSVIEDEVRGLLGSSIDYSFETIICVSCQPNIH